MEQPLQGIQIHIAMIEDVTKLINDLQIKQNVRRDFQIRRSDRGTEIDYEAKSTKQRCRVRNEIVIERK